MHGPDLSWLFPEVMADVIKLGRSPGWLRFGFHDSQDDKPRTAIKMNMEGMPPGLSDATLGFLSSRYGRQDWQAMVIFEAFAAYLGDGPKVFAPSEEQWEAMEHVELNIPVGDYRQPYPALAISIPLGARARLAREAGIPVATAPLCILIRHRVSTGDPDTIVGHMGQGGSRQEVFYLFSDGPHNPTIEDPLSRDADKLAGKSGQEGLFQFGHVSMRAAMNLALMLCQTGCHVIPRPTPKNRAERRESQLRGDFETVRMNQEIVVRGHQSGTGTGEPRGPGCEVKPHWRKGHWRSKPGFGARRAAGEKVPLLFIKPVLVRGDRAVGDLAATTVSYRG